LVEPGYPKLPALGKAAASSGHGRVNHVARHFREGVVQIGGEAMRAPLLEFNDQAVKRGRADRIPRE
jgi:hypothetical protein